MNFDFWKKCLTVSLLFLAGCTTAAREGFYTGDDTFKMNSKPALRETQSSAELFTVGAGKYDITGDLRDQTMGGYAVSKQVTKGVLDRLYSRAFYFEDPKTGNGLVYISVDNWSVSLAVREAVIAELQRGSYRMNDGRVVVFKGRNGVSVFNQANVMIAATHTHAGFAGFDDHTMYNISAGGKNSRVFDLFVEGIVHSVALAYENRESAVLSFVKGDLSGNYNVSHNRSMGAHLNNETDKRSDLTLTEWEAMDDYEQFAEKFKAAYTDKEMTVLKITAADGRELGCIAWFGVHPCGISASNHLVSGDTKGRASLLVENFMNGEQESDDDFVCAQPQTNLGDVGEIRVQYKKNLFGYTTEEEYQNVMLTANFLAARTLELYAEEGTVIKNDGVNAAVNYIDFTHVVLDDRYRYKPDVYAPRTAPAAVGYAAGIGSEVHQTGLPLEEGMTVDTPPSCLINFAQGLLKPLKDTDTVYDFARILYAPDELKELQKPKRVLMVPSRATPSWVPQVLPVQLYKIGGFYLAAAPFETTTVSGRRIRKDLERALTAAGASFQTVVYNGNTNAYASYMTSPEEYEKQHYEGGFTLFGINQLGAVMQETERLVSLIQKQTSGRQDGDPEWVRDRPQIIDSDDILRKRIQSPNSYTLAGTHFGQLIGKMPVSVQSGNDLELSFRIAGLNRPEMLNRSYFYIQRYLSAVEKWVTVADDSSLSTWFQSRGSKSYAKIDTMWKIPSTAVPGVYRYVVQCIMQKGKTVRPVYAYSPEFEVTASAEEPVLRITDFSALTQTGRPTVVWQSETPIRATTLAIRMKEDYIGSILKGKIIFDDGTAYPLRSLSPAGEASEISFPEREIRSVAVQVDVSNLDGNALPDPAEIVFYDRALPQPPEKVYVEKGKILKIDNYYEIVFPNED